MHYTRLYADADGLTHFADSDIPLAEKAYAPPAPPFLLSDAETARTVAMTEIPPGWVGDWHPSPVLQWWFQLAGELEVEVGDGEKRRFVAGSIVRVEDTTGRGHVTRVVGTEPVRAVYVRLDPSS
jgi:quercetin dioxygenase-like cupin family protein